MGWGFMLCGKVKQRKGESLGSGAREASLRRFHVSKEGARPKVSLEIAGSFSEELREEHSLP